MQAVPTLPDAAEAAFATDFARPEGTMLFPPDGTRTAAAVRDPDGMLADAMVAGPAFWDRHARSLTWFAPWQATLEGDGPAHRWFVGGRFNITANLYDRHLAAGRGGAPALTYLSESGEQTTYSYADALSAVCRTANVLRDAGVQAGDRVILYMPLCAEGIFAMHACARIGAVHSVVYAGMGAGALRSRIQDAGARVVIYADATYRRGATVDLAAIAIEATAGLPQPVRMLALQRCARPVPTGHTDLLQAMARAEDHCAPEPLDASHPLFILYTSGTTGTPKGIVHTHAGYAVGVDWFARSYFEIGPSAVWWSTSDIGWIVGHSCMSYGPFLAGGHQIIREGAPDFPDPGVVWRLVEQLRVTQMFAAPTLIRMYMKYGPETVSPTDRSSLRLLACAGEPLNAEALLWARDHILTTNGHLHGHVIDNFWQTEVASPLLATLPAMPAKPGHAGVPMPTVKIRIVDADGDTVGPGQAGSLVVTDPLPYMTGAIWNDPQRYASIWSKKLGGYVTGDYAAMAADGYVAILGRSDDVINVAGHRLGTAEIESSLIAHPAVAECAVIGLPDEIKGTRIQAFVTPKTGQDAGDALRDALLAHVSAQLGPIARPSALSFVEKLPKTRSGKIMRRVLRAQCLGEPVGDLSTQED